MAEHTNTDRTGGNDAVCFTAGPKGAAFAAGTIHAFLAADRKPPLAAAGISTGALSAAAMQHAYHEVENSSSAGDLEVRRWTWFRKYLHVLSDSPLEFLWKAIPDPVDFFADKPPVVDLSCPPVLEQAEAESRRHYYVLTRLGTWLAGLPIRVRTIARAAISYVRWNERYGLWGLMWVVHKITLLVIALRVLARLCLPGFLSERTFRVKRRDRSGFQEWFRFYIWSWRIRPLFGWQAWTLSLLVSAALIYAAAGAIVYMGLRAFQLLNASAVHFVLWKWFTIVLAAALVALGAVLIDRSSRKTFVDWAVSHLLDGLGISRGVLNDYNLLRALQGLFGDKATGKSPKVSDEQNQVQLVIVAAALQRVTWRGKPLKSQQVWAERGAPLGQALRAALCVPGVFAPLRLSKPEDIGNWLDPKGLDHLDLVDGAGISQNPLTSFFEWLRDRQGEAAKGTDDPIAKTLCEGNAADPRIHVVYNVPVQPYTPEGEAAEPERMNIVEVAFVSGELARRRDTRQEARQANFTSQLESYVREGGGRTKAFPIFADEIAPERDIAFDNSLDPRPDEIRKAAAEGCRRTLETLYRDELRRWAGNAVPCGELLSRVAPRRFGAMTSDCPGVQEVCSHCSRLLHYRAEHDDPDKLQSFGMKNTSPKLLPDFKHLNREQPRIVFLASGGVFRGSFHAGVLAAMHTLKIHPDLVVGASVGALMGGALSAITVLRSQAPDRAEELLVELVGTFLCVDRKVALTRTLKNTSKQLGVRALRIKLSPRELRGMIGRGGRADAGFAAVGAPPALIDALSDLFVIPHGRTRSIATEFVAGHITSALNRFWRQVQKETLPSLNIETALMGTSLLEPLARKLLGEHYGIHLDSCQPYHAGARPVSFFCTTSDLHRRRSLVLGRDFLKTGDFLHVPGSYDFVNATLSSAAFPTVFAPRCEAELLPGRGARNVLLADGGMFDNLPFFPAIEVLSAVQSQERAQHRTGQSLDEQGRDALEFLAKRQDKPDLIIAAALDADPPEPKSGEFATLRSILERVDSLKKNVKSKSFAESSERVGSQIDQLLQHPPSPSREFVEFVDSMVPAGVLQIVPTDKRHINGTFSFCRSAGMDKACVQRSIADGCFQTMRAVALVQLGLHDGPTLNRSVAGLTPDRIPRITVTDPDQCIEDSHCPFYSVAGQPLPCPFRDHRINDAGVREVRHVCAKDPEHSRLREELFRKAPPAAAAKARAAAGGR